MPRGRWATLQARTIYKEALEAAYQAKRKDLIDEDIASFNSYINEKILKGIALQEITSRFKIIEYGDSEIGVQDRYLKKTFSVRLREGKLVCTTDESDDDVHVFFVKNDPKVGGVLKDKGYHR